MSNLTTKVLKAFNSKLQRIYMIFYQISIIFYRRDKEVKLKIIKLL